LLLIGAPVGALSSISFDLTFQMSNSNQLSLVRKLVAAAAMSMAALAAQANTLTFQGVTFTTWSAGNDLMLEIDAANPTGDWASAVSMDSLSIKNIGSFGSVSLSGPGGAWNFGGADLNAGGCEGSGSDTSACFSHSPVALADNMLFKFSFSGGSQDFSSPHLKVRFLNSDGLKQGSLLSTEIPAVPEPESYALALAGLACVGFVARRRKV
jgi:hypothetical protein